MAPGEEEDGEEEEDEEEGVDTGRAALDDEEMGREAVRRDSPPLLSSRPPFETLIAKGEGPTSEGGEEGESDSQHSRNTRPTAPRTREGDPGSGIHRESVEWY